MRTSMRGNVSGYVHPIILTHSLSHEPPIHRTTWVSQESWVTLRHSLKMWKPSSYLSRRSARRTNKWRDGTASLQQPNKSSWWQAHQMVSTYLCPLHNPSTASWKNTTPPHYKPCIHWPTQVTTSTSRLHSSNTSSKAVSCWYTTLINP